MRAIGQLDATLESILRKTLIKTEALICPSNQTELQAILQ